MKPARVHVASSTSDISPPRESTWGARIRVCLFVLMVPLCVGFPRTPKGNSFILGIQNSILRHHPLVPSRGLGRDPQPTRYNEHVSGHQWLPSNWWFGGEGVLSHLPSTTSRGSNPQTSQPTNPPMKGSLKWKVPRKKKLALEPK